MQKIISPSFLSANFVCLQKDIDMLNASRAEWFHMDIMDGRFVPNISFGFPVLEAIRAQTSKVLDVHLMIVDPDRYIERFADVGADYLTVHAEACIHLHRTLQKIKSCGIKAGVALNPHTPLSAIEEILYMADLILIMSVNPGFGAQAFIESSLNKIKRLRNMIDRAHLDTLIETDGGVSPKNAASLFNAGCNVLVAGNAIFKSEDPIKTIDQLLNAR